MKNAQEIHEGQRWRSRDKRDAERTVTVIGYSRGMTGGNGYVVVATSARRSTMREHTLRSRYDLVSEPAATEEAGR